MSKLVRESLNDKLSGPSEEELINRMDKVDPIDRAEDLRITARIATSEGKTDIVRKYFETLQDVWNTYYFAGKSESMSDALKYTMAKAISLENLEILELALKYGGDINDKPPGMMPPYSFAEQAILYKKNPEIVKLMLTYDDINKENLERIKKELKKEKKRAETFQIDDLEKIEDLIAKYNPNYEETS